MDFSICSYSFNRWFPAGKMDIFSYIQFNKDHGFTQLDPWMKHLEEGYEDEAFLAKVKAAAADVGLPFGCIAVDGAHIYEPTEEARAENRARAYRWIDIAQTLGAKQVRIDTGSREDDFTDEVFEIVVEGYHDVIAYAQARGIQVIVENHWGPTRYPANVVKVLKAVDGLGLLFDTYNWAPGTHEEAWPMCAPYASLTHVKTLEFDEDGNDPTMDVPKSIRILRDAGYQGTWGIESVPKDGDEGAAVLKTLALIKRTLGVQEQ